jgi:ATP-binding protein involved in chromosome partitioning
LSESISDERIRDALRTIHLGSTPKDIVAAGMVRSSRAEGRRIDVALELPSPEHPRARELEIAVNGALRAAFGDVDPRVTSTWRVRPADAKVDALPGVANVVAVASGKGGVGKSTIASNLAVGLARAGARAGLLDLDLFGPSAPVAMGSADAPETTEEGRLLPAQAHGVSFLSMGMLAPGDRPVVWRGPMLHKAVMQLAGAQWGELDYLVLDLPPGTGDVQLTVTQSLPVVGAVIVTTPQTIALLDAAKGLAMFEGAHIPVLGIVENMAGYTCAGCGKRHAIFGEEGGARLAKERGAALLAEIPLDPAIMAGADRGRPVVLDDASAAGEALRALAIEVAAAVGDLALRRSPFKVLA